MLAWYGAVNPAYFSTFDLELLDYRLDFLNSVFNYGPWARLGRASFQQGRYPHPQGNEEE
jgi:hypothetical protein